MIREVGELLEEDAKAGFDRSEEVEEQMPDVRWVRSCYSAAEGKPYCEYEAPSLEILYELERRVRIPVDHAMMVQNLKPSMLRP